MTSSKEFPWHIQAAMLWKCPENHWQLGGDGLVGTGSKSGKVCSLFLPELRSEGLSVGSLPAARCALMLCAAAVAWPPTAVSPGRLRAIIPKRTYRDVLLCACVCLPLE